MTRLFNYFMFHFDMSCWSVCVLARPFRFTEKYEQFVLWLCHFLIVCRPYIFAHFIISMKRKTKCKADRTAKRVILLPNISGAAKSKVNMEINGYPFAVSFFPLRILFPLISTASPPPLAQPNWAKTVS